MKTGAVILLVLCVLVIGAAFYKAYDMIYQRALQEGYMKGYKECLTNHVLGYSPDDIRENAIEN